MANGVSLSFTNVVPVTLSDTTQQHFGGLLVLTAGNLTFRGLNSTADITVTGLTAGQIIPIETSLVKATLTTCTVAGLA
jgi:hypothetical protein